MTEKLHVDAETGGNDDTSFTLKSIMDGYTQALEARRQGEKGVFRDVIDHMKQGFPTLIYPAYGRLLVEAAYASAMANVVPWDPDQQYAATQAYAQAYLWGRKTFPFALEAGGELSVQVQDAIDDVESRRASLQTVPAALPQLEAYKK